MKVEKVMFGGAPVGLKIVAEDNEEMYLLKALGGLRAAESSEGPWSLFLCPRLPWPNVQRTPEDAAV